MYSPQRLRSKCNICFLQFLYLKSEPVPFMLNIKISIATNEGKKEVVFNRISYPICFRFFFRLDSRKCIFFIRSLPQQQKHQQSIDCQHFYYINDLAIFDLTISLRHKQSLQLIGLVGTKMVYINKIEPKLMHFTFGLGQEKGKKEQRTLKRRYTAHIYLGFFDIACYFCVSK